jgi:hypothetical protein
LGGFCNRFQNLCLGVALWNGRDPFLKERLFGVSSTEGNHGEDVKEYYYYQDATPTYSYCRMLYKYPQARFPYEQLVNTNQLRSSREHEFELLDALSASLAEGRYFDVSIEYAKATPEDILCRITVTNRGPEAALIHLLPQIWFRNTWSWWAGHPHPELHVVGEGAVRANDRHLGQRWWYAEPGNGQAAPFLLCTENETNSERLFEGVEKGAPIERPHPGLYPLPGGRGCHIPNPLD